MSRRMPDDRAEAMKAALRRHDAWVQVDARAVARAAAPGRRARVAAAGIASAALVLIALVWMRGSTVELVAAPQPESVFERLARQAHERGAAEGERPHLDSTSRSEVVQWVQQHVGLSLSLADRSGSHGAAFALEGASLVEEHGLRAGVVSYRIDNEPVTLLTAHEQAVPEAVRWSPISKRIQYRTNPETGVTLLSWANSGQAYVLVSALPGRGQRACLICHADGRRDAVIASLGR